MSRRSAADKREASPDERTVRNVARTVRLSERHVVGRIRIDCEPQVFDIPDDTDDLHPLVPEPWLTLPDALANGLLVRQEAVHKALAHDRHRRRVPVVVIGEIPGP